MKPFEIVIVDYDAAARIHLSQLLTETMPNVQIVFAEGGDEAIVTVLRNRPDIIFLDDALEQPDCLEVLKEIWRHYQAFVVLTGWCRPATAQCRDIPFLSKPYDSSELALAIELKYKVTALRRTQAIDQLLSSRLCEPLEDLWLNGIRTILASDDTREELLPVAEITHFKREGKVIALHTTAKRFWLRESLDALEYQLDRSLMIRTSQNEIINIAYLENLTYDPQGEEYYVLLQTGQRVKWEKGYREHIKRSLARVG